MNSNPFCRALQHLLLQGFTLYTCPSVVCVRLAAPQVIDAQAWACYFQSPGAVEWAARMREDDPLRAHMLAAADGASPVTPKVLCHFDGTYLALPLDVAEVRHAMSRLEVARNLGMVPTSLEGLAAVPDDVLALELKRRRRQKPEPEPAPDPVSGTNDGQTI